MKHDEYLDIGMEEVCIILVWVLVVSSLAGFLGDILANLIK